MRKQRVLLLGLGVAAIGLAAWWAKLPRTPEELFVARCSNCHELPDMGRYGRDDMAAVVRMMRTKNGADKVIDEDEAKMIVRYLEGLRP